MPLTPLPKKLDEHEPGPRQAAIFCAGVGLLIVLLTIVLTPTLHLGFVADDFFLLVNDHALPLTQSTDELHRPLRNATLRIVESRLGIRNVWPYRVIVAGTFLAALALLFQLARRLGANRIASLAAVYTVAFFPRNQEVLFWFAAWQDLVAAAAMLGACVLFLKFRESHRAWPLIGASVAYVVAIGFKETTIVLPALLLFLDLYRERSISPFSRPSFLKPYILFTAIFLVYIVYYFSDAGLASLAGRKTGGYYGFHGVFGVLTGLIRALINIALPYGLPLGLKDIRLWHVAIVLFEAGLVLVLVWRLRIWDALTLAIAWLVCTIAPTATFAAAFNADRYLLVPLLGAAIFVGLFVHAMLLSPQGRHYWPFLLGALVLYTSVGSYQLLVSRRLWQQAGIEAAGVIRETMSCCARLAAGSEVDFVNVTHSLRPRGQVFANGLSEALHGYGFPLPVRIWRNFSEPVPEQAGLVAELLRCGAAPSDPSSGRIVLVEDRGQLFHVDTGCASTLVDSDRARRRQAWALLFPDR